MEKTKALKTVGHIIRASLKKEECFVVYSRISHEVIKLFEIVMTLCGLLKKGLFVFPGPGKKT